ncbi:hypothetical protein MJ026_00335 [Acinetobacter ursingii]|uniref:hypothetical protein n=2 Tax=Acinetobacter ursingii TaxID=108980 RepID=UPI000E6ADAAE|nr:hypothetical protein [Acinetobacter ursingii]MDA3577604.1 hypothetical protein [Acinetobacter ursingii]MDH0193003.1 hypothetical protein [Acinetobacter ursingii]MDH0809092.1 hypothetical protein [Acinetobacter ursingii]MDH2076270.1 hypothetical protein [Acinetobacter ursingii]
MNTSNSPTGSNTSTAETKFLEIPIVQFVIFIIITGIYFFGIYHFFGVDFDKIKALEPNALGDFLAGTFAPLGFILLILGYMLNTSALKIQAQELRNSVQEQQALVETAKNEYDLLITQYNQNQNNLTNQLRDQELKDEFNSMPVIQFKFSGNYNYFEVINIGSPVIDISLIKGENIENMTSYIPVLKTNTTTREVTITISANKDAIFSFEMVFKTTRGLKYKQKFKNDRSEFDHNLFIITAQNDPEKIEIIDC